MAVSPWHAVKAAGAGEGSTALVIEAWPIGLGLLLCVQAVGASGGVVSEPSPARAELAGSLAADVVDPREVDLGTHVLSLTDGAGSTRPSTRREPGR